MTLRMSLLYVFVRLQRWLLTVQRAMALVNVVLLQGRLSQDKTWIKK